MIITGIVSFYLFYSFQNTYQVASASLSHQAKVVNENLNRELQELNNALITLVSLAEAAESKPDTFKVMTSSMRELLGSFVGVETLIYVDVNGVIQSSNRPELIGLNVREKERYQAISHSNSKQLLYLSEPFVTPLGRLAVGAARVVQDSHGQFHGYVMAILTVNYFHTLLSSVSFAPDIYTTIIHSDGKIIYRVPANQYKISHDSKISEQDPFWGFINSGKNSLVIKGEGIDNKERLMVFKLIESGTVKTDKKLVFKISHSTEAIFATWQKSLVYSLSQFGIIVIILIGAMMLYQHRQKYLRRLEGLRVVEKQKALDDITESELRWRFAIEGSGDGLWDWDITNNKVFFSKNWKTMLGYDESDVSDSLNEWERLVHPDDYEATIAAVKQHLDGKTPVYTNEHRLLCKDGSYKWILDRGLVVSRDEHGTHLRAIGTHTDISDRREAEETLRIAAIAFESQEGMFITDVSSHILSVNSAFTRITGFSAEDVIGKTPHILSSGVHDKAFYNAMWKSIVDSGSWSGEIMNRRKNGEIYTERLLITAVKNDVGETCNYVASISDITEAKSAAEKIHNLAFYDPLTRLPNRSLLFERLQHAMASSARSKQKAALLFIDIDHFKNLNDTLGHVSGDLILQEVAARLMSNVREGDTIARIGGDEFVMLLEDLSLQSIEAATQVELIVHKLQTALSLPYQINMHNYICTVSIGATLVNSHDKSFEELLKQADIALYQAKESGRNALRFFDPEMQNTLDARVKLENELRIAIEQQQFELYYQVQVDNDEYPVGAEGLIRWQHPERGLTSPAYFIQLAEDAGLILQIGQWVIEAACKQLELWRKQEFTRELSLSINVSAKQFHRPDFVDSIRSTLSRYDVDPAYLKLEITESVLLENIEDMIPQMIELKKIGLRFELDDFGTGYSSLQYLKILPLSQLKIDQSFVRDIATDSNDRTLVRTIISMAHNLDLKVVAEGVETNEQLQFLKNNGCDHYQGYFFGRPLSIAEFEVSLN